jgi:hypothetical protein
VLPALLPWFCGGLGVGSGLGPGLACESADAASTILGIDLPARTQVLTHLPTAGVRIAAGLKVPGADTLY